MNDVLLEARDIKKHFPITRGIVMMRQVGTVKAVDGVSFHIHKGETFGLLGESGCGKTTIANLILLLESLSSGTLSFEGMDLQAISRRELETGDYEYISDADKCIACGFCADTCPCGIWMMQAF